MESDVFRTTPYFITTSEPPIIFFWSFACGHCEHDCPMRTCWLFVSVLVDIVNKIVQQEPVGFLSRFTTTNSCLSSTPIQAPSDTHLTVLSNTAVLPSHLQLFKLFSQAC